MYVNLGPGAFRLGTDYTHKDDVFGYGAGVDNLLPKTKEVGVKDDGLLKTAFDDESPKIIELTDDKLPVNLEEYGYGFWLRFLTTYPKRLLSGKN